MQTKRFGITLLVRKLTSIPPSRFAFQQIPDLVSRGIDVQQDGFLDNHVYNADLIMNGDRPWRGARQKSPLLFQMLIESCTLPGDVVLDATAMIGDSLDSCLSFLLSSLLFQLH